MGIGTSDPVPVCCAERRGGVEGISALIVRGVLKSFLGKVIRGTVTHTLIEKLLIFQVLIQYIAKKRQVCTLYGFGNQSILMLHLDVI